MVKKVVKKPQAVRLEESTVNKLKNMYIEMGGVEFKTYDDKVNHLIWFFDNYKNQKDNLK